MGCQWNHRWWWGPRYATTSVAINKFTCVVLCREECHPIWKLNLWPTLNCVGGNINYEIYVMSPLNYICFATDVWYSQINMGPLLRARWGNVYKIAIPLDTNPGILQTVICSWSGIIHKLLTKKHSAVGVDCRPFLEDHCYCCINQCNVYSILR